MRGIPDAVCWYEGMHLLPQHFQLQSLRAETLSARLAHAAHPWFWGVGSLQVDSLALSGGTLHITALDAVMPDGLAVDFDPLADKDYPLQLKLGAEDFADQRSLMIYLAVDPLWRAGELQPLDGRLRSDNISAVRDLSSAEHVDAVTVWRPRLRLVKAEGRADSVCLPLLRLGCEDQVFSLLPYTPPCPVLLAESPIHKRISDLCFLIRRKCEFLAGRWRQAQDAGNSIESAELRQQLSALWARLPELQASLEAGVAHPATLHLQLVGMAGALASLQPEQGVRAFAPLKYEDLQAGFDEVLEWLEPRLHNIRVGYRRRSFQYKDKHFFIDLLDRKNVEQQLVIGLRMPSGATPQAAREWLERAIIASRPQLPSLSRQRMHGLAFTALDRTEQIAYGVGEEIRLFKLHARGEWFVPDTDLCLFVPPGTGWVEPAEIVIFDASKLE